jgi:CheY-like chemotaxis protein
VKYTTQGKVTVECKAFGEPEGLRREGSTAVEIVVADTGCGISCTKLESIFREFEQVESAAPRTTSPGLGLGLAVVARIVEQLGGQLRVESKVNEGSRFLFLIPFTVAGEIDSTSCSTSSLVGVGSRKSSSGSDIDDLVEAFASDHMSSRNRSLISVPSQPSHTDRAGSLEIPGSKTPLHAVKIDPVVASLGHPHREEPTTVVAERRSEGNNGVSTTSRSRRDTGDKKSVRLRVLIVEARLNILICATRLTYVQDDVINSKILGKRMLLDGHTVVHAANGQECVDVIRTDHEFDCILMDIQYVKPSLRSSQTRVGSPTAYRMPLLNGYEATERVRMLEKDFEPSCRLSHQLNGRIPTFAVSASLVEEKRQEIIDFGIDGWILKPIDFKRLRSILTGIMDPTQRKKDLYSEDRSWESGGWFRQGVAPPDVPIPKS